ncbi:MAG TPA: hypothetical protein VGF40_18825, partial [Thermoanaerobaculia bacterium]
MRTAVIAIALLTAIAVAIAVMLVVPRLAEPGAPRLEAEASLLAMMAAAPDDFETVVAIPTFASTWRRFSPLIEPLLDSREDERSLAAASWLIGNAPVAIWTSGGAWGALARPDPLHRIALRIANPFVPVDLRIEGDLVRFGPEVAAASQAIDPSLVRTLEGHLFILHGAKGSYPPMERPALTALRFGDGVLRITSRGRAKDGASSAPPALLGARTLPSNALLAARFAEPPRAVLAMEKTAPIRFERLLGEGAMVALYGVEEGGLIPRPLIAFSVPADDATYRDLVGAVDRAMAKGAVGLLLGPQPETTRTAGDVTITHREGLGLTLEYARRGDELLFAFDDGSVEQLLRAREISVGTGSAIWSMRARPAELLPALEELGSSRGLRLLARGFSNAARDLARA